MRVFLTSSFLPYEDGSGGFDLIEANGFADTLRSLWPKEATLLMFASDPDSYEMTDRETGRLVETFHRAGLAVGEVFVYDHREKRNLRGLVRRSDVIFLAGGHAPTQLRFMREVGLAQILKGYGGIVIGLSAGSLNSSHDVYMMPELPGESVDPLFSRFTIGLGISEVQIIPHREFLKTFVLDGNRFVEDIVLPDSAGKEFYFIPDGSYFYVHDDVTELFGEADLIKDGEIIPIKSGVVLPSRSLITPDMWKSISTDGMDVVFALDTTTGINTYYHISDQARDVLRGISCRYEDFVVRMAQRAVEEEIEPVIDQARLQVVKDEIKQRGIYVRTFHMERDSERRAKNIRIKPILGSKTLCVGCVMDISTALDHDWMTDEYARTGFIDQARILLRKISEDEELSLVYTNVKGFKAINELFGNEKGDMVIFVTRDVLRKKFAPFIVGRLESDHYVLITKRDRLTKRRLNKMAHQIYSDGFKEFPYEIRFGIYDIVDRDISITHMIDRAKLAEKSIDTGRGDSFAKYDELVKEEYVRKRVLLNDMKDSLEAGEFQAHYQPTVRVDTGEIASAEALIRWYHHDMGMVSPGEFVPIIETEGKISVLDGFMVDQVMDFVKRRLDAGERIVPCAINLSRVDFYDSVLMEHIISRLHEDQEIAGYIRVEVTESAYADLEKNAMEYLNELKSMGIKVMLDDYGSGMSSLSTLESFDFDVVKLDMGFVRKIGISKKAEAIIESTIKLSHALGSEVTAEGVETKGQFEFLKNVGCDYIQGYYFYRPCTREEFELTLDDSDKEP